MSVTREQSAVLALTRATAGPWHHTARAVEARGSALRLAGGDFAGLGEHDRAHAAGVVARLRAGDLDRAGELIDACPATLVTVLDDDYPGNLAGAHNLQPFLWVSGRLREQDRRSVAVADGGDAPAAARALAAAGLTVVSGTPAVAEAALTAGGRAIAVTPGGLPEETRGPGAAVEECPFRPGAVRVCPFWPGTAVGGRTLAVAALVTSGLAAALYVTGAADGDRAAMALSQGRHVFVPCGLPWTPRLAYRGGVTVVPGIDELVSQAVNLVDVTRPTTVF
ncbi:hypothetical protein DMB42_25295 [Nonomuraea sp. WAC 01424]|uniref:DNA-processing protein DprA n=1 Tax=Nonomuraea sp. WAC 01424 TaxID=2203200 RepID=UPI0010016C7D|nr:DNA-processing protein DprA [Nonomuraea sp. WAC 01424]RSN06598.1 hypothetical protein DMB42_25295 [Nonomuraea sp. WAC 01424]